MTIRFGTDGWRAVISDTFTFENVRLVAQAIADYVKEVSERDQPEVVVGFDTRFLSDRYALEVARVMAGNGILAYLTRADAPTPAVSYAIVDKKAEAGVMLTASHNPPRYNGIKLKANFGGSALPEQAHRVEALLDRNQREARGPNLMDYEQAMCLDLIQRFDPAWAYYQHISTLVDLDTISRGELQVIVDGMYGSGRGAFRDLLSRTRCHVYQIRCDMNPGFGGIHPEPMGHYLHALVAAIQSQHAEKRGWSGAVVKSVSTTRMVNRLAKRYDLPLYETPVGFNYIADYMLKDDVLIGGEESGGLSIKGHIPEGDGILMGMLLLEIMADAQASLRELVEDIQQEVGPACYARRDIALKRPVPKKEMVARLTEKAPAQLAGETVVELSTRDGVKYILADDSWLLIRPSGTEPVLRVYAEGVSNAEVKALLTYGEEIAGQ